MAADSDTTQQDQIATALAALGIAFARTLYESGEYPRLMEALRVNTESQLHALKDRGDYEPAMMLMPFALALHDKELFPPQTPSGAKWGA